ncbi:MAG: VIT1/CCC1 transporter family protein [Bacteroidota bacterium]|nr:VIT1/CCC1 transporter family protein [Bacteroidota bacterium]
MGQEKHFKGSQSLTDIVLGMSDGLTVPFALAAGLSSALDNNNLIITAGLAEVVAGSIAMGLGGYLAAKTGAEHYHNERLREAYEIEHMPEAEEQEVDDALVVYGISADTRLRFIEDLKKNKENYIEFMMRFELGLERPNPKQAYKSGIVIGFAYVVGGMIPLLSYWYTETPNEGLMWSSISTGIVLLVFGYFKSKLTGQSPVWGAIRVCLISAVAATAAYLLAKLVGG